jgi:hypothetical protein
MYMYIQQKRSGFTASSISTQNIYTVPTEQRWTMCWHRSQYSPTLVCLLVFNLQDTED